MNKRFASTCAALLMATTVPAYAAEPTYPFEGTWIRAERTCTPGTLRSRTYTAREVTSPLGHCAIRRVAASSGVYELLEECRRSERPMTVTETIRLTSPETMTLKRQVSRLKIPRSLRYARCNLAAASPSSAPPHGARLPAAASDGRSRERDHSAPTSAPTTGAH